MIRLGGCYTTKIQFPIAIVSGDTAAVVWKLVSCFLWHYYCVEMCVRSLLPASLNDIWSGATSSWGRIIVAFVLGRKVCVCVPQDPLWYPVESPRYVQLITKHIIAVAAFVTIQKAVMLRKRRNVICGFMKCHICKLISFLLCGMKLIRSWSVSAVMEHEGQLCIRNNELLISVYFTVE